MNRRYFLKRIGILSVGICTQLSATSPPKQPNILYFMTDDESWLERSVYGWSTLPTPHFDRVAREGVLFTNAFTSAPSCAPSRASVLTGRNFWELRQGAFIQAFIPKEFPIFPKILADHGYKLGYTGKAWGPGSHPTAGIPSNSLGTRYNHETIPNPPEQVRAIDYAANFARFLKGRKPGQPFFFWAGIIEPHEPSGKTNYLLLEKEFGVTLDQVSLPPFVEDTLENRKKRASFLYEICWADRHLGRMLKTLEEIGELDNTLVVVTSDNGTAIPYEVKDDGCRGKASPFDFGVHEPLAMMWPEKIKSGRTVTDFVSFADFAPTFLEAAGVETPSSMSGKSLMPIFKSKKSGRIDPKRDFIMTGLEWHGEFDPVSRSSRTIRDDRYAYVLRYSNVDEKGNPLPKEEWMKPAKIELYDLKKDPWQLTDLSKEPAYAKEMKRLANKQRQVAIKTGDPRFTGDIDIFQKTRWYVQERKRGGYKKRVEFPE
jgi:N-sulfoglucosamine sulfohydrolase